VPAIYGKLSALNQSAMRPDHKLSITTPGCILSGVRNCHSFTWQPGKGGKWGKEGGKKMGEEKGAFAMM